MKKSRLIEIIREIIQEELSLQELSPETMKSYKKKAKDDRQDHYHDAMSSDSDLRGNERVKAYNKVVKRTDGIKKATKKIDAARKPGDTWTTDSGKKAKKNQDGTITYTSEDVGLDEKITDYLPGKMNSASAQAKQQGLEYAGFGRWKNQQGKVVAKTVGGRLQKVDVNMGQLDPKDKNPKTKPIDPSKPVGGPQNMKEKVRWAAREKVKQAYKNPEVQKAAKNGTKFTGQQMTRLTGIPEKAFAAGHNAIDGSGVKILGMSDVGNPSDTIHYDSQTKLYTFVSDKHLDNSPLLTTPKPNPNRIDGSGYFKAQRQKAADAEKLRDAPWNK
jgi:hypothetical protein